MRNDAAEHSGHRLSMVQTVYGPDLSGRAAHVQKRDESQRDVQDQDTSRFKQKPLKRMRNIRYAIDIIHAMQNNTLGTYLFGSTRIRAAGPPGGLGALSRSDGRGRRPEIQYRPNLVK